MLDSVSDSLNFRYEFMLLLNDIYRRQEVTFLDTPILFPCLDNSYKNNFLLKIPFGTVFHFNALGAKSNAF